MKKNNIKHTFKLAGLALIASMIGIFSFMMPGSTKLSIPTNECDRILTLL
jgi:hypothetical protein